MTPEEEGRTDQGLEGARHAGAAGEDGELVTLVGLVLEAAAGLHRTLEPGLEDLLGVGGQSFEILIRLGRSRGGRLRMSDLAAQTGLTPSGLTRAVDRLVQAGLVERAECPSDRRGAFAMLTELGSSRAEAALERHASDVATVFAGLYSPAERAEMAALLRRLRDRVHPHAALVS